MALNIYFGITCLKVLLQNNFVKSLDMDQEIIVKDFGVNGTDSILLNLTYGLQPGSVISVISRTEKRGTFDIYDEKCNDLLHVDINFNRNFFLLTSKYNKRWLNYEIRVKNPVVKGELTVTTVIYENKGYRVFVNSQEIGFYEHQINKAAKYLHAFFNKIFKVVYITTLMKNSDSNKNLPPSE